MIGIEERDTNSGIHAVRVHYTADPEKRSEEWLIQAKQGLSERHFRKEYCIDWTVASGMPVYDSFIRSFHVANAPIKPIEGLPVYRGWDFGLTPACVFCQLDAMARLRVLACHVTWNGRGPMVQQGIDQFAEAVIVLSEQWFPRFEFRDYADPAGSQKAQTDQRTCFSIMNEMGIHPMPGPVTWTARKHAMVTLLGKQSGGEPCLSVSPVATMIVEGFDGAYKYESVGDTGRYKETVEKNAWSHPMNGLEYVVGSIYRQRERKEWEPRRKIHRDRVTGY